MRKDAPDQSQTVDPEKLSTEVEKLQSIQSQIKNLEDQIKDLKEDEKYFSCVVIPKLMEDMNLSSLKLKDGSELSVKKIFRTVWLCKWHSFKCRWGSTYNKFKFTITTLFTYFINESRSCNNAKWGWSWRY